MLFSLVPLCALFVSILDLVLPRELRTDIVDWLFHRLPGSELTAAVTKSAAHPGAAAPLVGIVAFAGLLWAASGMMASIRTAFRVAWEQPGQTYARGKLRDFVLVGLSAVLILAAFGISLAAQLVAQAGKGVSAAIGLSGSSAIIGVVVEVAGGLAIGFCACAVLYAVVPPKHVLFRQVWPVAALAAVAVELLVRGFAVYVATTGITSIYGPLATVFAFLLLVYLLATILLFGAELIAATERHADAAESPGTRG